MNHWVFQEAVTWRLLYKRRSSLHFYPTRIIWKHPSLQNEFQLQEVKLGLQTHNFHNLQLRNHYPPSSSQPSRSLPAKNALGDVKDQVEDKANPKPWHTADEKSSKMSTEDLLELIRKYPLLEGWYAPLPGLQEPVNHGTKFKTVIYEKQVKLGYRLPLHPFALLFFEHYHMAPGQLVPNYWRKLAGLIYLVQTSGYKPDATDFMRVFFEIYFVKGVTNCPGCQISEQHLVHGVLPLDKEFFQNQTHETFACSFAQAVYMMYASGSKMLSRFEMARQVAAEEAQQKRDAVKDAEEATRRAEELSKKRLTTLLGLRLWRGDWNGNTGEEWLKKRTDDGLEIYEMGFMKAKEMFVASSTFLWVTLLCPQSCLNLGRQLCLRRQEMPRLLTFYGRALQEMPPSLRFCLCI
ncbi:hypothetical protein RJ639_034897 [Escallonia herrerae]|uniref:Transposase (putative) gypsy type domain-containing protein n=1 Tax=Escallonia herrerae TaxID=1293975 RepID=A0AA89BGC7_9ASTE|nr:hypothetical protein RJ639_034897 [Escallonia herrerae]